MATQCSIPRGPSRTCDYRSAAPIELVQCPRVSLPLAQVGVRPSATLAAGQVHAGKLKCCLGSGAFDPGRPAILIPQWGQRRLSEASDPEERGVAPSDLNSGRLGRQPPADHSSQQPLKKAAFLPPKDRLQFAALLGTCTVVDVQPSRRIAGEDIAWPLSCESDLSSAEIYPVGTSKPSAPSHQPWSGIPSGPSQHGHNILQLHSSTLRPESCQVIVFSNGPRHHHGRASLQNDRGATGS